MDAHSAAATWLATFAQAVARGDAAGVAESFLPRGWLRDVLTFAWDTRALQGREAIRDYLTDAGRLAAARVTDITLETNPFYAPREATAPSGEVVGVEGGFTYGTQHARGRGYAHLRQDESGTWRALTLGMVVLDLKAHPEPVDVAADWESTGRTWGELEAERKARIESDPEVLIVGGGQNGVTTAARFRQMNIPTLVIERDARVGNTWRKRYQSLALHTPSFYSPLLYQPFPSHWPLYAPKDLVGDWLDAYATNQHLTIWTSTTLVGQPTYNPDTRRWRVTVSRAGTSVTLHPKHIVLATGLLGAPYLPSLPGRTNFTGVVLHASAFDSPAPFEGKRVVVVGAGNSAIDVCQDLATRGAASVTMVQRSPTVVVSRSSVGEDMSHNWVKGEPVEVGDFKFAAQPLGFFKEMNQANPEALWARERELHAKLRKGGVQLYLGPEGEGQFLMVFARGGGYWLDKGGADLIADGRIAVKRGAPTSFNSTGRPLCFLPQLSATFPRPSGQSGRAIWSAVSILSRIQHPSRSRGPPDLCRRTLLDDRP
ncbi:NAD(P)/FAD-dependent oxidoreductase [Phanerochaete sordida]|uniref:NAD(P)/FAD-dependent oxidoreductase n=1 Tax=Phanerochaete sordida TaxID=48140 RepID=A0A9P3LL48_9APHY|nr:NAD(P)/FAD-dependent oxidoreductase [Phanerochaete sordida]